MQSLPLPGKQKQINSPGPSGLVTQQFRAFTLHTDQGRSTHTADALLMSLYLGKLAQMIAETGHVFGLLVDSPAQTAVNCASQDHLIPCVSQAPVV